MTQFYLDCSDELVETGPVQTDAGVEGNSITFAHRSPTK
jgi:hypothetical protein